MKMRSVGSLGNAEIQERAQLKTPAKSPGLLKVGLALGTALLSLGLVMVILVAAASAGAQAKQTHNRSIRTHQLPVSSTNAEPKGAPRSPIRAAECPLSPANDQQSDIAQSTIRTQSCPIWSAELPRPSAGGQQTGSTHGTIHEGNVTITGPTEINHCDVVTFTVVATNDAVTATNVIITSAMPVGFTPTQQVCSYSSVGPTQVITCHAVFTATCSAVSGQNVVTLTQTGASPIVKRLDFVVNPGAITLRKEPSVVQAKIGEVVTWTIYVENTRYGVVSNVRLTDTLGSGLELVSALTPTGWVTIPVETVYSSTISARVIACSGLENLVTATWGCDGETCQTQTAKASVDLQTAEPLLDYTPLDISIDYCTGYGTFTMPITNTGDGDAFTPTLEVNFSPLTVTSSSAPYSGGKFHLSDILSSSSYVLTFTLSLPDPPCGVAGSGGLLYESLYYDPCGNPF